MHTRATDLNIPTPCRLDERRIEVIQWPPAVVYGAQLAVDSAGQPRQQGGRYAGAALHEARQAKESYYPELQGTGRCPLVVFAVEGRGAMKHRSSTVPPLSCPQHSPNSPSTNMPCHSHGSHCSVGRLPHACAGKRISLSWGSSWPKTQKFPSPQPPAWPIANSTAQLWISCVDFPSVTLNETFCRKANTVHAYRLTQQKTTAKPLACAAVVSKCLLMTLICSSGLGGHTMLASRPIQNNVARRDGRENWKPQPLLGLFLHCFVDIGRWWSGPVLHQQFPLTKCRATCI